MASDGSQTRIGVIGAGPSGLAVCRTLMGAGLSFDCYEAGRGVGGIWDVEGSRTGGYRSLHTNTSKTRMAYSDFPFPEDAPDFLHHSELLAYFEAYVDRFDFRDRIRFDCRVKQLRPRPDGGWQVELEDGGRQDYEACIVATGQYGTRRWPDPRPAGAFDGDEIHAADYLDPMTPIDCRGKSVVVVGLGSSAAEIATELAGGETGRPVASRVFLSARSGRYILPKRFGGQPLDARAPHPSDPLPAVLRWMPKRLRRRVFEKAMAAGLGRIEKEVGRPSTWNLPNPTFGPWAERPTLSEGFIPALETGRIEPRPDITRFEGSKLVFADGSTTEADVIVWATGYRPAFPFLDEEILGGDAADLALYQQIAHPSQDGLFFVGFTRVSCSLWPVSEQQARWLVGVLTGSIVLPNRSRMQRASIQVSKSLPVFCSDYAYELGRDRR